MGVRLDPKTIQAIESALKRKCKVEIIPVKDGIRVYTLRRSEIAKQTDIEPCPK